MSEWHREMEELSSAEEFLDFFGIKYDAEVVRVHRLHILQRFHDYLRGGGTDAGYEQHGQALHRAYEDFVRSDARTEKVFKVFRRHEAKVVIVPLADFVGARP